MHVRINRLLPASLACALAPRGGWRVCPLLARHEAAGQPIHHPCMCAKQHIPAAPILPPPACQPSLSRSPSLAGRARPCTPAPSCTRAVPVVPVRSSAAGRPAPAADVQIVRIKGSTLSPFPLSGFDGSWIPRLQVVIYRCRRGIHSVSSVRIPSRPTAEHLFGGSVLNRRRKCVKLLRQIAEAFHTNQQYYQAPECIKSTRSMNGRGNPPVLEFLRTIYCGKAGWSLTSLVLIKHTLTVMRNAIISIHRL